MKVVHIFLSLGYGGIETMLVNIANAQAKQGADVSIVLVNDIVSEGLKNRISEIVHLYEIKRKQGTYGLSFISRFNKTLDTINPDILHFHESSLLYLLDRRWRKVCRVVTLHDIPQGKCGPGCRIGSFIGAILMDHNENVRSIKYYDKVFSISKSVSDCLKIKYGIESVIVLNGIETARFYKQRRHIEELFRIIMVSRLNHNKKGQDLLINALYKLNKRGHKNIEASFIGEGESEEYLKKIASNLHMSERVHFLGAKTQDYIQQHLCDYDLLVQPSRYEGFGLTVAEGMAAKLPVLVSSGQGPAEVIKGELYGWVFQTENVESFAEKIEYILTHKNEALTKAERAYKYVCTHFDVGVTAKKYLQEYMIAIDNHK